MTLTSMTTSTSRTSLPALPHSLGTSEPMPPLGAFPFVVLLFIYMSDSIENTLPNSISTADLQKLADAAKASDPEVRTDEEVETPLFGGLTEEEVWDSASEGLSLIQDKCNHPIGHKVAAVIVISNMIDWHIKMAKDMMKDGEFDTAEGWLKDAGKFQAIMNILTTIEVGPDDFTITG